MRPEPPAPQTDAQRLAWLRLSRSRNVGPRSFRSLVGRFGGAARALDALPDLASRGGARAYEACSERQGVAEMERAAKAGARMLCLGDDAYPGRLAEIIDPPPFLWALGDPSLATGSVLGVIGARNASSVGLKMARMLGEDLGARGHVIASGLARGVDAIAHSAALKSGTIGVLAGGVDVTYPAENADLAAKMKEQGLLLSEAPMGLEPQGRHFPRRNRIVSGVSRAIIVIEAAARSVSLITARYALDQGREAMATPGSPLDPRAAGCNELIRQGAALIRDADDVEDVLGGPRSLSLHEPEELFQHDVHLAPDPDLAARAAALLTAAPVETDQLARDLAVPAATLSEALLELDLAGRIERRPGGLIALAAE
ncbi:MAG: DNA-processing protein DprA [Pseudomonadota bacterium]